MNTVEFVRIVNKHKRQVEMSPGIGKERQDYAVALCDDILAELDFRISETPSQGSEARPGVGTAVESNTVDENRGSAETGGEKADV